MKNIGKIFYVNITVSGRVEFVNIVSNQRCVSEEIKSDIIHCFVTLIIWYMQSTDLITLHCPSFSAGCITDKQYRDVYCDKVKSD